jgi:hypothetical protein
MRVAVIACPALLFLEFRGEFNRSGSMVPAGIMFCPKTPAEQSKQATSNMPLKGIFPSQHVGAEDGQWRRIGFVTG